MIDKERRAEISRENGRKSRGPVTPKGKSRSAKNGLIHGKDAKKYADFVPRNSTVLSNEDRQAFYRIYEDLSAQLAPSTQPELNIVHRIADAEWRLNRWELIESLVLEAEFHRLPESLPDRFQFLDGAEEVLHAVLFLQGQKVGARLFPQIRHQQEFYHRIAAKLIDRYIKFRTHFPPDRRARKHPVPIPAQSRPDPGPNPDQSSAEPDANRSEPSAFQGPKTA